SIYIQNKQKFTKNAQHLNDEFIDFLNAKLKVKYISLTKLGIFFKVYKCESFKTKFGNFLIYNIPFVYKILFKLTD
ncbi:MAG: hypothetical protein RR306_05190, partial [Clostridia bacterium]